MGAGAFVAYALGTLRFGQLLVVAVVVGAAHISFRAASGSCLKGVVPRGHLLAERAIRGDEHAWCAGSPLVMVCPA